jgi:Nif-specific regulatory protein
VNAAAVPLGEVIFMDNENIDTRENVLERCVIDCEKTVIIHALTRTKGNQTAAAKLLGTTRRILDYKIHKYRIDREQFRCVG